MSDLKIPGRKFRLWVWRQVTDSLKTEAAHFPETLAHIY